MSNEIAAFDFQDAGISTDVKKALEVNSGFLPRIQVTQTGADVVKQGLQKGGLFHMVEGTNFTELGAACALLLISRQPKAADFNATVFTTDPSSEVWANIAAQFDAGVQGYARGYEYLFYLKGYNKFVTMLFGSKTLEREAPAVNAIWDLQVQDKKFHPLELKVKYIKSKRTGQSWHGLTVHEYLGDIEAPSMEDIYAARTKFLEKPKDVEAPTPAPANTRER